MPHRDIKLPSFDEMVKMHQEGRLDALLEAKNKEFMDSVPENAATRHGLERLQFQISGLRARHQGLGRVLALSRLMHMKFEKMGGLLLLVCERHYANPSAEPAPRLVLVHDNSRPEKGSDLFAQG